MDLSEYLEPDTSTLAGATRIRGTRLSVAFLLSLLEAGGSEERLLAEYPQLGEGALRAVFSFARQSLETEQLIPISS